MVPPSPSVRTARPLLLKEETGVHVRGGEGSRREEPPYTVGRYSSILYLLSSLLGDIYLLSIIVSNLYAERREAKKRTEFVSFFPRRCQAREAPHPPGP